MTRKRCGYKNVVRLSKDPLEKLILPPLPVSNIHKLQPIKRNDRDPKTIPELYISKQMRCVREMVSEKNKNYFKDASLALHRKKAMQRVAQLNEQWAELEEKEILFRCTCVEFQQFLRLNFYKRERVLEEYNQNKAINKKRKEEMKLLRRKFVEMSDVRVLMRLNIKKFESIYWNFLQSTTETSCKFKEIHELINFYFCLAEARDSISSKELYRMDKFVKNRHAFQKMLSEKSLAIENMLLKMTRLIPEYSEAKTRVSEAELNMRNIVEKINSFKLQNETALAAIYSLYIHICRKNCLVPLFQKGDFFNHLPFINWSFGTVENIRQKMIKIKKDYEDEQRILRFEIDSKK